MTYDTDEKLEQFRINGFVVFEDLIAPDKIDRILEAWVPIRDAGILQQGVNPVRGRGRYNVPVPYEPPFLDEDIFEQPALVSFLEQILGHDYVWFKFDSNIPLPGTDYQKWHRDISRTLYPQITTPTYQVGVKFPLCGTCEENGSFEAMPCTQYIGSEVLSDDLNELFGNGANINQPYHSRRINLKKGSLWIHDNRVIHRGTPNRSDKPRDELCMAMSSSWVFSPWQHENIQPHFSRSLWESLSEHAQQVLSRQRIAD